MTLSGWCMDGLDAVRLGRPHAAAALHAACRFPDDCSCPCHKHEPARKVRTS